MDNYTSPKEREYQNEIVKLFREELHYNYLGKLQYGKNRQAMDNGVKNSPVIESELRSFLSREGSSYTDFQIEEAIRLVKDAARLPDKKVGILADTNNAFYEILISHLAIQPDSEKPHENVYLFDFDNPLANNFAIAEEVSFIDPLTGSHSRPDIVLYVNGID